MAVSVGQLSGPELRRFRGCPVKCPRLKYKIQSLADYFSVISSVIGSEGPFWFRGHADADWSLTPFALRYGKYAERERALRLISEFKRVAEIKLTRPPRDDDELKWAQLARHYGLPTRLLDWSESATIALYFACEKPIKNGMVFILNPIDLNRLGYPKRTRILDVYSDKEVILKYLRMRGKYVAKGTSAIAINPVWNSERLMLQRGVFTLHGSRFDLTFDQAPSLVAIPVLSEYKNDLLNELQRVGVDEMTIFPELEHSCNHMRRKAGLTEREW